MSCCLVTPLKICNPDKIAAFTIQLAQPIRLDPPEIWEVGLCVVSYSASPQQLQILNLNYFVNALMYCDLITPSL